MNTEKHYKQACDFVAMVRKVNKLSLRQLSKITGIDHTKIHRMEKGIDVMSRDFHVLTLWASKNNPNVH